MSCGLCADCPWLGSPLHTPHALGAGSSGVRSCPPRGPRCRPSLRGAWPLLAGGTTGTPGELDVAQFVGEHAREEAPADRVDAEIARTDVDLEVVVLTADSLDELKRTHGRYFLTPAELVRAALDADLGA